MKKSSPDKITSSHTTKLEACTPFVKFAQKSDRVDKISLGIITMTPNAKGGSRRIKCTEDMACLLVTVRANRGLQKLCFFCKTVSDVTHLKAEMLQVAKDNHFAIQT